MEITGSPQVQGNLLFVDELRSDYFESLLQQLDPDRDLAGQKYEDLRRKLIKFFEWNSCFPAEDLVDETFDRVAGKLENVPVHDVIGFAWGFAKHIRQEAYKRADRMVQISDLPQGKDVLADANGPDKILQKEMEHQRRAECLHRSLQRLPREDRQLFLQYHNVKGEHTEYRQQLAANLGMTVGTLRVRINRLREKLERSVNKCLTLTKRDYRA